MTVVYYIFFEHPQSNASSVSLCTELGGTANKAAVARNAKELERKHKQILYYILYGPHSLMQQ